MEEEFNPEWQTLITVSGFQITTNYVTAYGTFRYWDEENDRLETTEPIVIHFLRFNRETMEFDMDLDYVVDLDIDSPTGFHAKKNRRIGHDILKEVFFTINDDIREEEYILDRGDFTMFDESIFFTTTLNNDITSSHKDFIGFLQLIINSIPQHNLNSYYRNIGNNIYIFKRNMINRRLIGEVFPSLMTYATEVLHELERMDQEQFETMINQGRIPRDVIEFMNTFRL